MLLALGVTHVIIGHSERRQYFGETDDTVNLRLKAALEAGLTPICCVGEVLQEREAGLTDDVLRRQCVRAFHAVSAKKAANLVVAYEPVWAIGTGKTATPELAAEAHAVIRREATRNIWRRFRREAAHSLWRIGKAGQCLSPDGAGGNRRRAGGRGVARSEIICGDCEVLKLRRACCVSSPGRELFLRSATLLCSQSRSSICSKIESVDDGNCAT